MTRIADDGTREREREFAEDLRPWYERTGLRLWAWVALRPALYAFAAKFGVRGYTRCSVCGRPHSVYRKFGLCRVCLRNMAHRGELPGVTKSSW